MRADQWRPPRARPAAQRVRRRAGGAAGGCLRGERAGGGGARRRRAGRGRRRRRRRRPAVARLRVLAAGRGARPPRAPREGAQGRCAQRGRHVLARHLQRRLREVPRAKPRPTSFPHPPPALTQDAFARSDHVLHGYARRSRWVSTSSTKTSALLYALWLHAKAGPTPRAPPRVRARLSPARADPARTPMRRPHALGRAAPRPRHPTPPPWGARAPDPNLAQPNPLGRRLPRTQPLTPAATGAIASTRGGARRRARVGGAAERVHRRDRARPAAAAQRGEP